MAENAENIYERLSSRVAGALEEISPEARRLAGDDRLVSRPSDASHGDFSSNAALRFAKILKRKPMEVASEIGSRLSGDYAISVASPGFVNITLSHDDLKLNLSRIDNGAWCESADGRGKRVNIEFVSANPTGPLHVGHGRGAVIGDVLGRILSNAGYQVVREYYVNDVGKQIVLLGESVLRAARLKSERDDGGYVEGYAGAYIQDVARLYLAAGLPIDRKPHPASIDSACRFAGDRLLAAILETLSAMGVSFDLVTREESVHAAIPALVAELRGKGFLYEAREPETSDDGVRREGSKAAQHAADMKGGTFLRTMLHGDETDRVILRENGEPTYFAADIAYHLEKFRRTGGRLIDVWGADHASHVVRMKAAVSAFGINPDDLEVVLCQMVRLKRGGVEVKMSKRSGEMIMLSELIGEVGPDAARFFFLMRSPNSQCDFDLDLAVKRSSENPVFYCQYAHARTRQLLAKGAEHGLAPSSGAAARLTAPEEIEIMRLLVHLPEILRTTALMREVHRLPAASMELAGVFHRYQTAGKEKDDLRIVRPEEPETSSARLYLVEKVGLAMKTMLGLMGVSAPERM